MRARVRKKEWGIRELGMLFATILSGVAVLALLFRWVTVGADSANRWVDLRAEAQAKKVVSDSLGYHKAYDRHGRDRRDRDRHRR